MIQEIIVKNLAIIEDIRVGFFPGLNVLTGETGAGKSIIVGAIDLVLGKRASSEMIRSGCETAEVQAVFDLAAAPLVQKFLADNDIEGGAELIVRRVINKSGTNRIYLNGSLVGLGLLREVGEILVNIYGQHESQGLLRPENHAGILDAYGALQKDVDQVGRAFDASRSIRQRLQDLGKREAERASREDYLRFKIREIEGAGIRKGELAELETKKLRLKGASQLAEAAQEVLDKSYESEDSIAERIERLSQQASKVESYDPEFADVR